MRFSWDFLQNMLENGYYNLQTKFGVHINYFQNNPIKKSQDRTNPPDLPTLKAYPTPGVGGRFEMFSLKWREMMNLKVPGDIFPLAVQFWAPGRKLLGGSLQPPFGELGLTQSGHL